MSSPGPQYDANGHEEYEEEHSFSSPRGRMTRTVAIIKNHALEHRFEIERRIQEASFEVRRFLPVCHRSHADSEHEILKERQLEFDTETDPETLEELFGEDAHSLAE